MVGTRSIAGGGRRRLGVLLAVGVAAATLAGCTDARLVDVWRDPDYPARTLRSVLVVAQRGDAVQRRLWEDALSERLARHDVDAVASHTLFPDAAPSRARMVETMRDKRFDAALMEKPLRATAETRWVPGWGSVAPREYYDPWSGRDVIVYRRRWHPGYARTDHIAREQLSLWAGDEDVHMVWAGTAEVYAPGSSDDLRREVAEGIPDGLRRAGLVRR